ALEYRTRADTVVPLTPAELGESVSVIRSTAHRALEDLRDVLTVLSPERVDGDGTEQPQSSLADLERLVAEARAAGQSVRLAEHGDTARLAEL
ncbi:hypothetical protein NYY65_20065, partial [Acinetobacter baumannii]|nr:hypothetical protein [Acinetobacter baumannii]